MSWSIGDFFNKGEFWTSLHKSFKKIKKKIKQNSNNIEELEKQNIIIMTQMKIIKQENALLFERIVAVEHKVLDLHTTPLDEKVRLINIKPESEGSD